MRRRQPLPTVWLMTDERIGDLRAAIMRLPWRSGIVFRHYALPATARRALFGQVERWARRGRHVLVLAAPPLVARNWGADGAHDRSPRRSRGVRTASAHSARELAQARRADLIFVSPVFATRSHPGARPLGRVGLGLIAGKARGRVVALGGMDAARFGKLGNLGLHGWAAIDAFRT